MSKVLIIVREINNNNININNKHIYKAPCMPTEGCRGEKQSYCATQG